MPTGATAFEVLGDLLQIGERRKTTIGAHLTRATRSAVDHGKARDAPTPP